MKKFRKRGFKKKHGKSIQTRVKGLQQIVGRQKNEELKRCIIKEGTQTFQALNDVTTNGTTNMILVSNMSLGATAANGQRLSDRIVGKYLYLRVNVRLSPSATVDGGGGTHQFINGAATTVRLMCFRVDNEGAQQALTAWMEQSFSDQRDVNAYYRTDYIGPFQQKSLIRKYQSGAGLGFQVLYDQTRVLSVNGATGTHYDIIMPLRNIVSTYLDVNGTVTSCENNHYFFCVLHDTQTAQIPPVWDYYYRFVYEPL